MYQHLCPQNLKSLLDSVSDIAREAGQQILKIYASDFDVDTKSDSSPLTAADLAANDHILGALKHLTPEVPILSEEAISAFNGPNKRGQYWLVDPLDGTKEFVSRNGEFTVNIALIEQGFPILGVIYCPTTETLYAGARGLGSYKGDSGASLEGIQVGPTGSPLRVVGSRSHQNTKTLNWLEKLGAYTLLPVGSSLKFCLVAEGGADLYPRLGPTSLWDTGAGQAIVESAGGWVKTLEGSRLSYEDPFTHLNPHFIVSGRFEIDAVCE